MKIKTIHPWDVTPREAITIQRSLKGRLRFPPIRKRIRFIAGADVSAARFAKKLFACVVVLRFPSLETEEFECCSSEVSFPYVPGLLSFREIPPIIKALRKIKTKPDVVICDGQGFAHPRRLGLASHLGLVIETPTIGCAKSCLIGTFREPGNKCGDFTFLYDKSEKIGAVLRTKDNVKPLFISPGNNVDLRSCIRIVLRCCKGYRLPETVRQAHHLVNLYRKRDSLID